MKFRFTLLLILLQAAVSYCGYGQNINTIIGGLGDGGAATAGRLNSPNAVAIDKWGNIYISDYSNNLLRKVETTGTITAFTGFGQIIDVAADTSGNVFIADLDSRRIFKMGPSGLITTYAGDGGYGYTGDNGPATHAHLSVNAIAVDRSGNLYISDFDSYVIRKVNTSGIITRFAGNGTAGMSGDGGPATAASFNQITGICADNAGNIYTSDIGSNRIRRIDPSGIISTFAGNGIIGYAGDGGLATAANFNKVSGIGVDTSGNVYIADNSNNEIRMVNTSGTITTVAGVFLTGGFSGDGGNATTAQLNYPSYVSCDRFGNFFIADKNNHRIRKVNVTGTISTVAGCGINTTKAFFGDGGPGISALVNEPTDIAYDTLYNLYIADYHNHRVRKMSGGIITTVAGNDTSGYSGDNGPASGAKLRLPSSVATDRKGNLFICDQGDARIRKVNSSGIITTYAGTGIAGFAGDGHPADSAKIGNNTVGIATDKYGNLYIADRANNRIRKVDTTQLITTIAGTGTSGYFGDGGPATSARFSQPYAVWADTSGNIFVADYGNARIRKINSAGIITTVAGGGTGGIGGPAIYASIPGPQGVYADKAGQVFIAAGRHIFMVDTTGIISNVVGSDYSSSGFNGDGGPATDAQINLGSGSSYHVGIAISPNKDLLLTDVLHDRVRIVYNGKVSITASNDTVCTGTAVTFTATATAASVYSLHYHWYRNDVNTGTDSSGYTPLSVSNGDKIKCVVTDGISGPTIATSNEIRMVVVSPSGIPTVSISVYPGLNICAGTTVTCSPISVTNGGSSPVYDWYKNTLHVATGSTYVYSPTDLDIVYCKIRSSITCLSVDTAMSGTVTFSVTTPAPPTLTIHQLGAGTPADTTTTCNGTLLTLTDWSSTLAASPVYHWYTNGLLAFTGGLYNFTPVNGDSVYCVMTTAATCVTTDTARSNTMYFVVNPPMPPTITISSSQGDTICPGTTVTLQPITKLPGSFPHYDWYKNGSVISHSGTIDVTPSPGDTFKCKLTTNASCVTTTTAMSNNLAFSFLTPGTSSVSITLSVTDSICAGTTFTITPVAVNGGPTPVFDWYKNGWKNLSAPLYISTASDRDSIYCKMTSSECVLPKEVVSNKVAIKLKYRNSPSVDFTTDPGNQVCDGIPVTCSASGNFWGPSPEYNWYLNGTLVSNNNPYTFTPADNDLLFIQVKTSDTCVTATTAISNADIFSIGSQPTVSISANPGQVVFRGTAITLTAYVSGLGTTNQFQWVKNGAPIPGATNDTYTSNGFSTWDSVWCELTVNGACSGTAISNKMVINTYHGLKLYPDPNDGHFVINGNNYDANGDEVSIRIYNFACKLVYEKKAAFDAITFYTDVDMGRQVPPGMYILKLSYSLENLSFFFVVK